MHLLRVGATPRRLAWSLAVGMAVGINPLLGSTTLVCLVAALALRLNLLASQITNHLMYPLQLAMFLVFLRVGDRLFHTGSMPLDRNALMHAMAHHPLATISLLWSWEWHALLVWLAFATVLTPLLVILLTPLLHRLHEKMHQETAAA